MGEPTGFAMKELFSQLIGRDVAFAQPKAASRPNGKQMFGLYTVLPQENALVVQADLALLGSFAGALVGLQDDAVKERMNASPLEELLRDAIHEVLNIASTVVTNEGRAVFKKMAADPVYFDTLDGDFLQKPDRKTTFDVSIDGYQGGLMTIFAQL
jgi:hypothetical protein